MKLHRAPYPQRAPYLLASFLRDALDESRSDASNGRYSEAFRMLEFHLVRTIADIEAGTVDQWEDIVRELEAARPL
jgi:hypothetical protein